MTQRMLTRQLRELEASGLILRKIYPQVPPKVEYSLSERGMTLAPILQGLHAFGRDYYQASQAPDELGCGTG